MLSVVVIQQRWQEPEDGGAVDAYLVDNEELSMLNMLIDWLAENICYPEELGNTIPHHKIIGVVRTEFSKDDDPVTIKMQLFKDAITTIYTDSRYEEDPGIYGCKPWPISMRWTNTHRITTIIQESKGGFDEHCGEGGACNEGTGGKGTGCACNDETVPRRLSESSGCDCRRSGECGDD